MIIPIRCFSCGKVISNIWNDYIKEVQDEYNKFEESKKLKKKYIFFLFSF